MDNDFVKFLKPCEGKIKITSNTLHNYNTTTLSLITGKESGYLIIDVDNIYYDGSIRLTSERLNENDCIVYSSKYTREDVYNGKCKYKIIYKYDGEEIPRKKDNKSIEVFYKSTYDVCIIGDRGDGYSYIIEGHPQQISYDINDYIEVSVPFDYLGIKKKKTRKKQTIKQETEQESINEVGSGGEVDVLEASEKVDIAEFRSIVGRFVEKLPNVIEVKNNETLLTFQCLFLDCHSDKKNARAYAFKRNGVYVCRCHGVVCSAEYDELNKQIFEYVKSSLKLDGQDGFPKEVHKQGVNVFVAPTGYGKTNACVGEMINAINNNEKILIILQSKEAIQRLLSRFDELTKNQLDLMFGLKKIYIYDSEHKDKENHEERLNQANVILSHHRYFTNAGNLLTYYPDSLEMLKIPNLRVIIDECHTYLEMCSRLDLEIGGLYEKEVNLQDNDSDSYKMNIKKLKRETMVDMMNNKQLFYKTACVEPTLNGYGTVELRRVYKLYDKVPQLDIFKEITKRYKKTGSVTEKELNYGFFENTNVKPMKPNAIEDTNSAIDLLLDSADSCIMAYNLGDDIGRQKIGTLSLALFHHQILKEVLNTPREVILTTATMDNYHYQLIESVVPSGYSKLVMEDKIDKADHIVLLKSDGGNNSRARISAIECACELNSKSLFFMPTIEKATEIVKRFPENTMLNNNDLYCIGKRRDSNDYVDNYERNVTVVGLESGVSKGYNYIEEIDNVSYGFELMYFDKNPISPKIIKKHIINGKVIDVTSDYNLSTFAQAIGRAFRKSKKVLCLAFNDVEDDTYEAVKKYLEKYTTAKIHESKLNRSNIILCISSYVQSLDKRDTNRKMKDNKLFRELYE